MVKLLCRSMFCIVSINERGCGHCMGIMRTQTKQQHKDFVHAIAMKNVRGIIGTKKTVCQSILHGIEAWGRARRGGGGGLP